MKLQTIETHIVKTPPPGFGGRYFIFVVLQTACGIRGYGEIYAASFAPETVSTMATDVFGRYLEDQKDISEIDASDPKAPDESSLSLDGLELDLSDEATASEAVSYTHLTLPTKA